MTIDQYLKERSRLDQQLSEAEALPAAGREKAIATIKARVLLLKLALNSVY